MSGRVVRRAGVVGGEDLLQPRYYEGADLPGAINIPHDRVDELAASWLPDRDALIEHATAAWVRLPSLGPSLACPTRQVPGGVVTAPLQTQPMPDVDRGLAAVSRRLWEAGVLDLAVGAGQGTGWQSLPQVLDVLGDWHADLVDRHGDRRAAAAYLAAWVAGTPSLVVGLPAMVGGVVPDLDPSAVHLRRHPQGFVDRYAIAPSRVRSGPGQIVLVAAADRIARLTAPLVERLSDELPVGPVALWGGVADVIGAYGLWFARQSGGDPQQAWSRSQSLLDHLAQLAPVRRRPGLFPVTWSGGTTYYPVRGTCCLYYRTEVAAGPEGPSYCSTCPLRRDESRTAQLVAHLESTA